MVRICNLLILFEAFFQILSVSPFAVNFISFILNFTIIDWRICFCFHLISTIENQPSITDPNIKILRSVFVISFIIIFGWIIGSAARNGVTTLCTNIATGFSNLFKDVQGNPSQTVYDVIRTSLISFVTCINPISAGINSVILIISNSEYRNAYNKAFGIKQQISINSVGPYFTNQRN
uniref:G_PROTEIN_RECEP_F1_2 domain-containing protein n=1 Tax=Meloidogyne hapla TaxID=6305 RepID=A0A1I8BC25_MELHA